MSKLQKRLQDLKKLVLNRMRSISWASAITATGIKVISAPGWPSIVAGVLSFVAWVGPKIHRWHNNNEKPGRADDEKSS